MRSKTDWTTYALCMSLYYLLPKYILYNVCFYSNVYSKYTHLSHLPVWTKLNVKTYCQVHLFPQTAILREFQETKIMKKKFFSPFRHIAPAQKRMYVVVQIVFTLPRCLKWWVWIHMVFSNRFYKSLIIFVLCHFGSILFLHPVKLCSPDCFDINTAARW